MNETQQLIAEVARLKARVERLEKTATDEFIEGWANAARVLGVTDKTCMNRYARGDFPKPCRTHDFTRADGTVYSKPTWRRADLIAYAVGKA